MNQVELTALIDGINSNESPAESWRLALNVPGLDENGRLPLTVLPVDLRLSKENPSVVYVRANGNDATAVVGREDLPWQTAQAAIEYAIVYNSCVLDFGAGDFYCEITANSVVQALTITGLGREQTRLTIYFSGDTATVVPCTDGIVEFNAVTETFDNFWFGSLWVGHDSSCGVNIPVPSTASEVAQIFYTALDPSQGGTLDLQAARITWPADFIVQFLDSPPNVLTIIDAGTISICNPVASDGGDLTLYGGDMTLLLNVSGGDGYRLNLHPGFTYDSVSGNAGTVYLHGNFNVLDINAKGGEINGGSPGVGAGAGGVVTGVGIMVNGSIDVTGPAGDGIVNLLNSVYNGASLYVGAGTLYATASVDVSLLPFSVF